MKSLYSDLEIFFQITETDLENKIKTTIPDKEIVLILQDGKRLRSVLAHLSFKACTCGKETPAQFQRALEGAVSIELVHRAFLINYDLIDKKKRPKRKSTSHTKKDVDNTILNGHKLLTTGFNIAITHGEKTAKLYVDTWNNILSGGLEEINFNHESDLDSREFATDSTIFDTYKRIIDKKTATLFSSACKVGAIEADMTGDILKVFADYGREIGFAYQLADDLVNLVKGKMIDGFVISILTRLENKTFDKDTVRKNYAKNLSKIKRLYTEEIKKHVNKAEELSKSELIPSSPYKDLLIQTPTYLVNKALKELNIAI